MSRRWWRPFPAAAAAAGASTAVAVGWWGFGKATAANRRARRFGGGGGRADLAVVREEVEKVVVEKTVVERAVEGWVREVVGSFLRLLHHPCRRHHRQVEERVVAG